MTSVVNEMIRNCGGIEPPLFVPPDIFDDGEEASAHCGPTAIGALLGKTMAEIAASGTPLRKSMNLTQARAALARFGTTTEKVEVVRVGGIAHVMFDGPWTAAGPRVQYRYSHWIAYRMAFGALIVYDVNAGSAGGWSTALEWERDVLPILMPSKGTGYHVNAWLEVL